MHIWQPPFKLRRDCQRLVSTCLATVGVQQIFGNDCKSLVDIRRRLQYARRRSLTFALAPQRLSIASRHSANSVGVSHRLSKFCRLRQPPVAQLGFEECSGPPGEWGGRGELRPSSAKRGSSETIGTSFCVENTYKHPYMYESTLTARSTYTIFVWLFCVRTWLDLT